MVYLAHLFDVERQLALSEELRGCPSESVHFGLEVAGVPRLLHQHLVGLGAPQHLQLLHQKLLPLLPVLPLLFSPSSIVEGGTESALALVELEAIGVPLFFGKFIDLIYEAFLLLERSAFVCQSRRLLGARALVEVALMLACELKLCQVDVGALVGPEMGVEVSHDLVVIRWSWAHVGPLLLQPLLVEALRGADLDGGALPQVRHVRQS